MTHLATFCSNSVYLSQSQRDRIDAQVFDVVDMIRDACHQRRVAVNVYLSGSLARQEPAIRCLGAGHDRLVSDFDFVVITPENEITDPWLLDLQNWLMVARPSLSTSVFFVPLNYVDSLQSGVARDLARSQSSYIYRSLDVPRVVTPEQSSGELLELLVHQAGGYLLYPDPPDRKSGLYFRTDKHYHRLKMILEAIRAIGIANEVELSGYFDIARKSRELEGVVGLASGDLEQIVRARELFGTVVDELVHETQVLRRAIGYVLEISSVEESMPDQVHTILWERLQNSSSVLDTFQMIMVALIFREGNQADWLSSVDRDMRNFLRQAIGVAVEQVAMAQQDGSAIRRQGDNVMSNGSFRYDRDAADLLRQIRMQYYIELSRKNLGASPEG